MAEKVSTQEDFTTARYSPPTAGLHQLRVQEGGTDTPLNVEVMPRRAGQIFTDLMKPTAWTSHHKGRSPHCGRMLQTLYHHH